MKKSLFLTGSFVRGSGPPHSSLNVYISYNLQSALVYFQISFGKDVFTFQLKTCKKFYRTFNPRTCVSDTSYENKNVSPTLWVTRAANVNLPCFMHLLITVILTSIIRGPGHVCL